MKDLKEIKRIDKIMETEKRKHEKATFERSLKSILQQYNINHDTKRGLFSVLLQSKLEGVSNMGCKRIAKAYNVKRYEAKRVSTLLSIVDSMIFKANKATQQQLEKELKQ